MYDRTKHSPRTAKPLPQGCSCRCQNPDDPGFCPWFKTKVRHLHELLKREKLGVEFPFPLRDQIKAIYAELGEHAKPANRSPTLAGRHQVHETAKRAA